MHTFLHANWTCFRMKFGPIRSLIMLKKHSTSSVVLERGCSGTDLCCAKSRRLHSLVSILLAANAVITSLVKPHTRISLQWIRVRQLVYSSVELILITVVEFCGTPKCNPEMHDTLLGPAEKCPYFRGRSVPILGGKGHFRESIFRDLRTYSLLRD